MIATDHRKGGIKCRSQRPKLVELRTRRHAIQTPASCANRTGGVADYLGVDVTTVPNSRGPGRGITSKLSWQKRLRGAGLTPAQYMVLMTISTYTDRYGNNAHPGWNRLVDDTGLDLRTIKRAATALEKSGHLIVTHVGGNQYGKGTAKTFALGEPWITRGASGAARGAPGAQEGGHPLDPHQVTTSGHVNHSAPPGLPHASAWSRMSYEDRFAFIEEYFDDLLDGGTYGLADSMVGKDYAPQAIVNAVLKAQREGGLY